MFLYEVFGSRLPGLAQVPIQSLGLLARFQPKAPIHVGIQQTLHSFGGEDSGLWSDALGTSLGQPPLYDRRLIGGL